MHPLCSRSSRESDAVDCVIVNFLRALPSATEKTAVMVATLWILNIILTLRNALHDIEPGSNKI